MPDPNAYTMSPAPWAVVLAAGQGTRLAAALKRPKQFLSVDGVPLYWHSVRTFKHVARLAGVVLVFPEQDLESQTALASELARLDALGLALRFTSGGARRQDSVRNGLALVPPSAQHVFIHDAARPFFTPALANRLLDCLEQGASAVIPGLALTDTIKQGKDGKVCATLPREELFAVQTPQGFVRQTLCECHEKFLATDNSLVTDDAMLMEAFGYTVHLVEGEAGNMKITKEHDLTYLQSSQNTPIPCTGFGYDVHRYGGSRPLLLGGVAIASDLKIFAHSDGDVLLHALMDALLGLAGKGDIGTHFPDSDMRFDNISSSVLLAQVLEIVRAEKITLTHADLTVVAQKPKVGSARSAIQKNVARLLGLAPEMVNVKATTEEGLGFTGEVLGIKAYAVVTGLKQA